MRYLPRNFIVLIFGMCGLAHAVRIGGGGTGGSGSISKATVKSVKTRPGYPNIRFKIAEANYIFWFDGSSVNGKNVLSALLTAQSTGSEIIMEAGCGTASDSECEVSELTVGSTFVP
jgi:hypothetical protein